MVKFDADPQVPLEKWIAAISKANAGFAKKIGENLARMVTEEIERTWDNHYSKDSDIFANENGASIVFTWGNNDEPPGKLSEGGELTAALPDGITRARQVSKTLKAPELIPVFRSIDPERSFRALRPGDTLGNIIPRHFDEILTEELKKEFETTFKPEIFYRVQLRMAGFG